MPKTIEELDSSFSECRWIYDDRTPKEYCAEPVIHVGSSYCAKHHEVVYVKSQGKRARLPFALPVDRIAPAQEETVERHPDLIETMVNSER